MENHHSLMRCKEITIENSFHPASRSRDSFAQDSRILDPKTTALEGYDDNKADQWGEKEFNEVWEIDIYTVIAE